jgi:SAM-dependent methyltransferase
VSRETLDEHRRIWREKRVLALVYAPWFDALLAEAPPGARVLEVGAGPGFFREYARTRRPDLRLVALDVLPTPWNDVAGDALRLPLRGGTVDAVLGIDVLHHLARPALFFAECARVLGPEGRLALVEPWVSPLSFPIYRFLHQEGCTLGIDGWDPFGRDTAGKDAFEGDAAVVPALVRRTPNGRWPELGLEAPSVVLLNGFAYLLSLGFKRGSLLPRALAPALIAADRALGLLAPLSAMRALAVWERRARAG